MSRQWRRAHDQDIDISTMSRSDLLDYLEHLRATRVAIDIELEAAQAAEARGEKIDQDWFDRAYGAVKWKGARIQSICDRLSAMKEDRQRSLEQRFIQVAKERLDGQTYRSILTDSIHWADGQMRDQYEDD